MGDTWLGRDSDYNFIGPRTELEDLLGEPWNTLAPPDFISILKELYNDDKTFMRNIVYKSNPFLTMIPKESTDGKK